MSKSIYPQKPIIVVVGPTASGKSDLAAKLAKKFNGEVISADSRQVYRGMDIGTGKVPLSKNPPSHPSPFSKGGGRREGVKTSGYYHGIPHYLLNVASPKRRFTAAQYKKLAQAAIEKIRRKNKIPIICGGTGFYIRALVDNLQIPSVKPDLKLRARLEKKTTQELFAELKKLDPRRAKAIDPQNPRRLVRALEIIMTTGRPVPQLNPPQPSFTKVGGLPPFRKGRLGGIYTHVLFLGIQIPRPELARRIKTRLQKRLKHGLLAEVKKLRSQGLSWKRLDDFGLEYRWLARYLRGHITHQEMVVRLQKDIEHYAKRQMTWFGHDKRIHWIKNQLEAKKIIEEFLKPPHLYNDHKK